MTMFSSSNRRSCKYPHCPKKAKALGYCHSHYKRVSAVKKALTEGAKKPCTPYEYHAVYVVGCLEFSYVKIGRAKEIKARFEQLQTSIPFRMVIYGARFGRPEEIIKLEHEAHRALTECDAHYRAEWFDVHPDDACAVLDKCISMHELGCVDHSKYQKKCLEDYGAGGFKGYDADERREWVLCEIARSANLLRSLDTSQISGTFR